MYRVRRLNLVGARMHRNSPYAPLLMQLTGRKPPGVRKRQAATHYLSVEGERLTELADAAYPNDPDPNKGKNDIGYRTKFARRLFKAMSPAEQKVWEDGAEAHFIETKAEWEAALHAPTSQTYEARET